MVKTVVLVSGGGANLQALIDANYFGELVNCELTAVISSTPDAHAITRAERANIPTYIVDYSIFPHYASFSDAILNKLRDLDAELIVMAGFAHELSASIVKEFSGKIINTFPSLMPTFFEGANIAADTAIKALQYGCKVTGATSYFLTFDDGYTPIILQKAIDVNAGDTADVLQRRIMEEAEWPLLTKTVSLYCQGKLTIDGNSVVVAD